MPDTDADILREAGDDEQSGTSRPFWSGTISFGLVSIPVSLFPAARSSHVGLRMLGPEGRPLQRRYFAPGEDPAPARGRGKGPQRSETATREGDSKHSGHDEAENDEPLTADQMVKGYEVSKGKYVIVSNDELERLAPDKSRDIDLREFVKRNEIAPIYFDRPYFLVPAGPSAKAYRLLAAVMERTHRAGIATFVMRGKEYLVAIFADNGILTAETMRFADEVRSPEDVGLPEAKKPSASLVRRFEKIIAKKSADKLDRDELRGVRDAELLQLVDDKLARKQDVIEAPEAETETGAPGRVVDLFAELKRSLTQKHTAGERHSAERRRPAPKHRSAEKKKRRTTHHARKRRKAA